MLAGGGCCAGCGCLWMRRTDVSCSVYNHVEELALERNAGSALLACLSVGGSPCFLGNPRGMVWAKTYAGASHLRNENEQGSQVGEISCLIESDGQRIVPDIAHRVRSREQAIPSIRKRFILSGYARAGEESQQRREA